MAEENVFRKTTARGILLLKWDLSKASPFEMQISHPSSHNVREPQPGHCSEGRPTPTSTFPHLCRLHGSEKGQFKANGWALWAPSFVPGQDALSSRKGHPGSQQKRVTEWGALGAWARGEGMGACFPWGWGI